MPKFKGVFNDSESGLAKLFAHNPEAENVLANEVGASQHAELTTPSGLEDIPAIKSVEPTPISPQSELTTPSNPNIPEIPKQNISPYAETGAHDFSEPAVQHKEVNYVSPRAEDTTAKETGLVPYKQKELVPVNEEIPSPIKPETANTIKDVLKTKSPEERAAWYQQFKDDPKKALAAIGIGGAVGYNMFGGGGSVPPTNTSSKTAIPSKTPVNKGDNKDDSDEETSSTSASKLDTAGASKSTTPPQGLQNITSMMTPQTQDYTAGLKSAQNERDRQLLTAGLSKTAVQTGSAIAGIATPHTEVLDNAIKQADNVVKDYDAKLAVEKKDPNSEYSKGLQKFLKNMYGIDTNASAEAISGTMLKPIETMYENQQKAKNHKEEMAIKYKELAQKKEADMAAKKEKDATSNNIKVGTQLESVRGNRALQNDLDTIRKVQNSMALIKTFKDPNDIPPQLITDMNVQLASIMSGGQAPQGLIKEVSAHPFMQRIANATQDVLNRPIGANAAAFVKQNEGIFNDFAKNAQERINDKYRRQLNTIGKTLPDEHREFYRSQYLPNDVVDKKGNFTQPDISSIKMRDPQGKIRLVPADQVDAAKDAGGVVVQ